MRRANVKVSNRKARRGFSLVELLAVVLILAVLAGVAVPVYLNQRTRAANRACQANITAIAKAASVYLVANGAYPVAATAIAPTALVSGTEGGLGALPNCPLNGSGYTIENASGTLTIDCADAAHAAYTKTLTTPATATGL
jgi:prepilin-type N-terminal cleavage/methylation domain-containing protein